MASVGSSEVRQDIAGRETGSQDTQLEIGGGQVDLSKYAKEESQPVAEPVSGESPLGEMAETAISGSNITRTAPSETVRAEEETRREPAKPVQREQVRTQQRPSEIASTMGMAGTAVNTATRDQSPVASTMQTQPIGPAPTPHPGAAPVLNMSRGILEAGAPAQSQEQNDQQQQTGANQLVGDSNVMPRQAKTESDPTTNPVLRSPEEKVKDDADTMRKRAEERDMIGRGREEIRRQGVVERPPAPNMLTSANRTFRKIRELLKDKVDRKIKSKTFKGMSFYETIFSMPSLMPHCVSLGSDNLYESLREPNSTLLALVNSQLPPENQLILEDCLADIQLLVDAINSVNIEVTLDKSPVNINHSIQVRVLRAHMGRGIGLHPTQTKAFNADYDGDPAVVNLDQTQLIRYARAMDRLVSIDGKPLIDPDFFPLEPIENKDEVLDLLRNRNLSWNPSIANDIIDAYEDACNNGNWVGLLRKIDEIAEREAEVDGTRSEQAAAILKSLYDFSIDIRALSINSQINSINEESSNYNPPDPGTDPFVLNLVNLIDEIVAGRRPPSFTEFNRFYNKYYGDVEGMKNVPFRLLADFAKAINRTDLVTVGSDLFGFKLEGTKLVEDKNSTVTLHDLWQFTCVAGLTKQISGCCRMGSRKMAESTQVRAMVLRDVPLREWKDEQDFRDWIEKFRNSYNMNMRMLNLAKISYRNGMTFDRSESLKFDGIGEDLKGIDEALVKVYGHKTIGAMFPQLIRGSQGGRENSGNTVARHYRNMTLDKFATNNRLEFISERKGFGEGEARESKIDAIKSRIANNDYTQMDILMLIADRRTKQFGEYNTKWREATKEHFDAIASKGIYQGRDLEEYAANVMETIAVMSPDMFLHFGMDSPATFKNSKWGKKLLNSKTVEDYQTHLLSMMIEYRLGRSAKILDEMKDIEDERKGTDEFDALEDALQCEFESLGSSSMVWKTIVDESMNGNATFKMLIAGKGRFPIMHGDEFWNRPAEEKEKYYSLINFLKSSEPLEVKLAVLADVTRVSQGFKSIHPNEVLGQIAHHPDRLHSGNRFDMMDKGIRTDLDDIKASMELLSSYRASTPDKIREDAYDFLEENEHDAKKIVGFIGRLATDPGYAVHVDTIFAADAIASVFDKTYADSEKIHQQASVNGYFGCVSYQRSGGYYTHLNMTDNAVVNMVGYDQITPREILLVLSDPTVTLYAYDEFGAPVTLSRESLCGGNTDEDVVRYLEDNPRVTVLCKRCMTGISDNVDGNARMKSIGDAKLMDTGTYRVFSLFNDRPRFLAVAALFTRSDWQTGRDISENINEKIHELCQYIAYLAQNDLQGMELIEEIEKTTGLSIDSLARLRRQGSFDEEYDDNDFNAAENLYNEVIEELLDCVGTLQKSGVDLPKVDKPTKKLGEIDQTSMIAYYDVRQQISGARTDIMIGIEGSETKKNLVLKTFLKGRPDAYTMSEDGTTVIPLVEGLEQASDQSLVHSEAMQTSSICKFLEIKRENGAETFNAKYKKYGDDGSNSMIKFIRMAKRSVFDRFGKPKDHDQPNGTWAIEDGADLLDRISACSTKVEAVPILAQALIDADIRLGYIDVNKETGKIDDDSFVPSDYWNRADFMIAENSDGTLVVRTLEQLSAAARTRLSDEAVTSGDIETVKAELTQILDVVGTDMDPMLARGSENIMEDIVSGIRIPSKMGSKYRIDRALRQRSSSIERNYALLNRIYKFYAHEKGMDVKELIPSRKEIMELSSRKIQELKQDRNGGWSLAKTLKNGIAFPRDVKVGEEWLPDTYGDRSHLYDYLGRAGDSDLRLIPGPQSFVLFDKPNANVLQQCINYGITAAFTDDAFDSVPEHMKKHLIQVSVEEYKTSEKTGKEYKSLANLWILPCFDMMLNEGIGEGATMAAPAEIPINPDNAIVNFEDTTYEFKEGDATYHITNELAGRINVIFSDTERITSEQLFPNAKEHFGNRDYDIDYCTSEEVQRYVMNGELDIDNLVMKGPGGVAVIDIGISENDSGFEREKARFAIRLQEYLDRTDTDDTSMITGDVKADSILGFVKINFHGADGGTVLAPIWPFHLQETGRIPTQYKATVTLDESTDSFMVNWEFTGSLEGQYIKFFEGIGASNKLITSGERIRSRTLENGIAIDGAYASASVASRLFSSNKRIHTMISAMMMTRMDPNYSYNFAELPDAFPGNPTFTRDGSDEPISIKEALLNAELGKADWKKIQAMNITYHNDPQINSIIKFWVDKCVAFGTVNPTTLLATRTPNGILWPKITEFECFMDSSPKFQEAWMKLMHEMLPTLMPDSIEGKSNDCLFVPVKAGDIEEDYGVLQMRVPHWDSDGREYTKLENVYISMGFFGEEFSGFKKVNFNAYKRSIDNLNVASEVNGDDLVQLLTFARAGMSSVQPIMHVARPAIHIEATRENAIKPSEKIEHDIFPEDDGITHVNIYSEINPAEDGVEHINVYSHGKTELGRFLSNFAHTPINLPEGKFESIEGYWHYLGLPNNCPEKDKLKKLWGAEARKVGRELRKKYGTQHRDDFKEKIRNAIDVKLETYVDDWWYDDLKYMQLEHYYVTSNGTVKDQRKQFGWFTDMIQEEIDTFLDPDEPHEKDFVHVKDDIYETPDVSFGSNVFVYRNGRREYDEDLIDTEDYRYKYLDPDEIEALGLHEYGSYYRRVGKSEEAIYREKQEEHWKKMREEEEQKRREKFNSFIGPRPKTEIL